MPSTLRDLFSPLKQSLRLRTQLIALIVAAMTPLLVFAVFMIYRVAADERESFRYGAVERTRAILAVVDTELKSSITTLEALATSNELDGDEIAGFSDDAYRVLKSQVDWTAVSLTDSSGQEMMRVPRASGAE